MRYCPPARPGGPTAHHHSPRCCRAVTPSLTPFRTALSDLSHHLFSLPFGGLRQFDLSCRTSTGPAGSLVRPQEDDDSLRKLALFSAGECEGLGPTAAAAKYGYTKQRYYQRRATLSGSSCRLSGRRQGDQAPRTPDELMGRAPHRQLPTVQTLRFHYLATLPTCMNCAKVFAGIEWPALQAPAPRQRDPAAGDEANLQGALLVAGRRVQVGPA
jgi:hypothetical protein